jgi:hypothetical protein
MSQSWPDVDPLDPRVQEDIRDAVQMARDSAYGSLMSNDAIASAAVAHFSDLRSVPTAAIEQAIRREVWREGAP